MAMPLECVDRVVMAVAAVSEGVIVDDAAVGGTGAIEEDGKLINELINEVEMDDRYVAAFADAVMASTVSEVSIV
jgi:hypothetical protein